MSSVDSSASVRREPQATHLELDAKDQLPAGRTTSVLATLSAKQKGPLALILVLHPSAVQTLTANRRTTNQRAGAGLATKVIHTTLNRVANHHAPRSGVAPTHTALSTRETRVSANASKASVETHGREENAHLSHTVQNPGLARKARSVLLATA